MASSERKSFNTPDEVRPFEKGKTQIVNLGGATIGRLIVEPGWKWSQHVKPIAGTEWCEARHFAYVMSGRIRIQMRDGTEIEYGPGDVALMEPGHDAWIVGNDTLTMVDWTGAIDYAKQQPVAGTA